MEKMKIQEIVNAWNNEISQIKSTRKKNTNLCLIIFIAIFSIIYFVALGSMLCFAKTVFISINAMLLCFAIIIALTVPFVYMIKLYGDCKKMADNELSEIEEGKECYRKAMLDRYIKQMDLIIEEYRLSLEQLKLELFNKTGGTDTGKNKDL